MGTPMTFTSCVVRAGWRFLSLFGHCSFPLFLLCPFGECLCVFVVGHGTRSKWSYEPPIHGRKYVSMILKTTFSWEVFPKLPPNFPTKNERNSQHINCWCSTFRGAHLLPGDFLGARMGRCNPCRIPQQLVLTSKAKWMILDGDGR